MWFPAFTLVEMVVVVVIITILVLLVAPAASTLWSQRKLADAENTVQGLVMTARARAIRSDTGRYGLFFFVGADGTQQVLPIRQVEVEDLDRRQLLPCPKDSNYVACLDGYRRTLRNVYEITEERGGSLPAPIRAVPRYAVDAPPSASAESYRWFSDPELGNNNFLLLPQGHDNAQRHRNYFTMVFSSEGHLLVGQDALIMDRNELNRSQALGDFTNLPVGDDGTSDPIEPVVEKYYHRDNQKIDIDPSRSGQPQEVPLLIVDGDNVAINFPSVDGLLIYDDETFNGFNVDRERRAYLARGAQPLYVNRLSGTIVRGPVGEVQ